GRWPAPPSVQVPEGHAYAEDLDVFGRASLYQLLGPPATPPGRAVLERWLLEPSPPRSVAERQEAVRELAGCVELREALALDGRQSEEGSSPRDAERFLDWAQREPRLRRRPGGTLAARARPGLRAPLPAL